MKDFSQQSASSTFGFYNKKPGKKKKPEKKDTDSTSVTIKPKMSDKIDDSNQSIFQKQRKPRHIDKKFIPLPKIVPTIYDYLNIDKEDQTICKRQLNIVKQNMPEVNQQANLKFITCGAQGVLLLYEEEGNKTAWKVAQGSIRESKLIKKVNDRFNKNQYNVIKFKSIKNRKTFEFEYIEGDSLEDLLMKEPYKFPTEKVIEYGYDILNGLIELQESGIYHHRDIRPANIMIDNEYNRAVIIDLGIATKKKDALGYKNSRYGGPHDLISLGQLLYRMNVGFHLFIDDNGIGSPEMEFSTYKFDIKSRRDSLYEYNSGVLMEYYLNRVYKHISSNELRNIISLCLQSENEDHKKVRSVFEHYLF